MKPYSHQHANASITPIRGIDDREIFRVSEATAVLQVDGIAHAIPRSLALRMLDVADLVDQAEVAP